MIVQSRGLVRDFAPAPPVSSFVGYNGGRPSQWWQQASNATYSGLYATQPNVRIVVDFLARNIAQLGIHAFRRISDNDRERLADHEVVQWLAQPNKSTTQYRLIEATMLDIGIYFAAYWMKLRNERGELIGLIRVSPETMAVEGWLEPQRFLWTWPDGQVYAVDPLDVVYFGNYNPFDPVLGLSPLETLRRLLAEEEAATAYRESFWENAARLEGVIERPATAPRWSPDQKQAWREQWQTRYAGPGKAGQIAVLEDGMTFKEVSYSARDSEYTASRKLSREECARAYHIPLPMVGILDHATFSNVKEQHKQLYQDALGPWLTYLQDEFARQLLFEARDRDRVYFEFNIAEKLKGSFEEQAAAITTLVGRPVMTANEGRARLNLPAIQDDATADALALPLNTSTGAAAIPPTDIPSEARALVIRSAWERQRRLVEKIEPAERAAAFDVGRWDRELASDLEPLYLTAGLSREDAGRAATDLATRINADTLQLLVARESAFSQAREAALYG